MKLPRNLDGQQLAEHLCKKWQYRKAHQTGSHIILDTDDPSAQRISVAAHRPLRLGTLNAILRAVAGHKQVTREDLMQGL